MLLLWRWLLLYWESLERDPVFPQLLNKSYQATQAGICLELIGPTDYEVLTPLGHSGVCVGLLHSRHGGHHHNFHAHNMRKLTPHIGYT